MRHTESCPRNEIYGLKMFSLLKKKDEKIELNTNRSKWKENYRV